MSGSAKSIVERDVGPASSTKGVGTKEAGIAGGIIAIGGMGSAIGTISIVVIRSVPERVKDGISSVARKDEDGTS